MEEAALRQQEGWGGGTLAKPWTTRSLGWCLVRYRKHSPHRKGKQGFSAGRGMGSAITLRQRKPGVGGESAFMPSTLVVSMDQRGMKEKEHFDD